MDIGSKLATATLGVDATVLRMALDQLRAALKRPYGLSPAPTAALALDRKAIADSVRQVLERFYDGRADPATERLLDDRASERLSRGMG